MTRWKSKRRLWHYLVPPLLTLALMAVSSYEVSAQSEADRIARLEEEVAALRRALAELQEATLEPASERQTDGERLDEVERRLDILAAEIEGLRVGEAAAADRAEYGFGPAASKVYRVGQGVSLGGYGEMLFQEFDSRRDDGVPSEKGSELDFVRGIAYVGYKFNDRWLFNSEIEFEHASTGQDGEVSLEFAYLDRLLKPGLNVRAGLLLVPMGFINELHEPPVFLGARRPDVERALIPTTWRENGFGIFGSAGPVTYRAYLINGLDAEGFSAAGIRGGRQKGSRARAEDLAWVGRLDYTGVPGLLIGASLYTGDSGQELRVDGEGLDVTTTLYEGHLEWRWRGLELRLLGVRTELDDVARLNRRLGLTGADSVGQEHEGFYIQLGYDVLGGRGRGQRGLIPFVRYESYDTQAEVPDGFDRDAASDVESWTWGLSFKPIDRVVIKVDLQDLDNQAGSGTDQFNVALGYLF